MTFASCVEGACFNGGICSKVADGAYRCFCRTPYTGLRCQLVKYSPACQSLPGCTIIGPYCYGLLVFLAIGVICILLAFVIINVTHCIRVRRQKRAAKRATIVTPATADNGTRKCPVHPQSLQKIFSDDVNKQYQERMYEQRRRNISGSYDNVSRSSYL